MSKFNVGDLVRFSDELGDPRTYGLTNSKALCIVINNNWEELGSGNIKVAVINHATLGKSALWSNETESWDVKEKFFVRETREHYAELFPDFYAIKPSVLCRLIEQYHITDANITLTTETKTKNGAVLMDKTVTTVLTNEERESLITEIMELLDEYGYHPTEEGVNTLVDKWVERKGWMIELFKKHPNYNGKFQIAFDSDYNRVCDTTTANRTTYWFREILEDTPLEQVVIGRRSFGELRRLMDRLNNTIYMLAELEQRGGRATYNNKTIKDYQNEYDFFQKLRYKYEQAYHEGKIVISGSAVYDKADYERKQAAAEFFYWLYNYHPYREPLVSADLAVRANKISDKVRAVEGMKVSRLVNKVCQLMGMDKHADYNRKFAAYSDAINPLQVKRHTVISCNIIDYLTMSFGNSWSSCHTIDKQQKRPSNNQGGCHGGGTLSYALDESSCVFYTVDKKYDGNELELQDKINRCMFHIGEDKIVQGRVYPQDMDNDEGGIYKTIREIMQKVIADCLNTPNLWTNARGTDACSNVIQNHYGAHYPDFFRNGNCNVSYLKRDDAEKNTKMINVGSYHICPSCGKEHATRELIECYECYHDRVECASCGSMHDADDMMIIDGDYYCPDCAFYCDYHERYELMEDRHVYIEGYGWICEDAYEYGEDFFCCERCGVYYHDPYRERGVHTEDDSYYCSEYCAERDGYAETENGYWYPDDEVIYCETCGCHVHTDDFNFDREMCCECAENTPEDEE